MNTFHEVLSELMKIKDIDDGTLANLVDVNRTTVTRWRKGIRSPKLEKIPEIASVFNVDPKVFIGNNEIINKNDISTIYNQLEEKRQNKVYKFAANQLEEQNEKKKVYTFGQTAAGPAIEYGDPDVETHYVESVPASADMALTISGDSMEPDFPNGSIVFYKRQPQVEHGEIAIVEIDGNAVTCKKVCYDFDNKKIVLQSLNDKYDDMEFEADQVRILGKVVK